MRLSVFATFSRLVGFNIVNDFFDILDCVSPDQVFITSLCFNIELLGGIPACLEICCVFGRSKPDGELLNLGLALREVLHEPNESLVCVGHRLQLALRTLRHYKMRAISVSNFAATNVLT